MKRGGRARKRETEAGEETSASDAEAAFLGWLEQQSNPTAGDFDQLCRSHPGLRTELTRLWRGLGRYEGFRAEVLGPLRKTARPSARRWKSISKAAGASVLVAAAIAYWPVRMELAVAHDCVVIIESIKEHVDQSLQGVGEPSAREFLEVKERVAAGAPLRPSQAITYERWSAAFSEVRELIEVAETASSAIADRAVVHPGDRKLARILNRECARIIEGADASKRATERALANSGAIPSHSVRPAGFIHGRLANDARLSQSSARLRNRGDVPVELRTLINSVAGLASLRIKVIDLDAGGIPFEGAQFFIQAAGPTNALGSPAAVDWPHGQGSLEPGDWRITIVDPEHVRHSELRVLAFPGDEFDQVAFLRATDEVTSGMAYRPAAEFIYLPVERGGEANDPAQDPLREICLLPELWVDPCEVTQEDWARFAADVRAHSEWFDGVVPIDWPAFADDAGDVAPPQRRVAMNSIQWEEAALFANWAGKRLPTDREWMRIAAGPTARNYPWGNSFSADCIDAASAAQPKIDPITGAISFGQPLLVQTSTLVVDDERFLLGATPAEDGAIVLRLGDNVSEYTEDLDLRRVGSSVEYAAAGTYKRRWRGGNWFFNGADFSSVHNLGSWVPRSLAPMPLQGLRCVKTRLDGQLLKSK
jgi:hypothetical protein